MKQSYLTQLWNRESKTSGSREQQKLLDQLGKYFTIILLIISFAGFLYWYPTNHTKAWNALTTVLIVACPCALLLSVTFTNGFAMRQLSRWGIYLRHASVLERLTKINQVVFDKTGTLTNQKENIKINLCASLSSNEYSVIKSIVSQSNHPLSRKISSFLGQYAVTEVNAYQEISGKGIRAYSKGIEYLIGSSDFVEAGDNMQANSQTNVHIRIAGQWRGYFSIENEFRQGLEHVVQELNEYDPAVISGDDEGASRSLRKIFGPFASISFRQSPSDKMNFIQNLQLKRKKVMMIGDGLNDSGALMQSDVGISISENINNFSPACDIIMEASAFEKIPYLLRYAKSIKRIIVGSFVLSLMYNIVGISLALRGDMHPVYAAILMPLSSISILLFSFLGIQFKQWMGIGSYHSMRTEDFEESSTVIIDPAIA